MITLFNNDSVKVDSAISATTTTQLTHHHLANWPTWNCRRYDLIPKHAAFIETYHRCARLEYLGKHKSWKL
jgi:hypothetical protein